MNDELHTFLRSRRSLRRYKPNLIPAPVIERILTTATHAPSAYNSQPWRFVVVTDPAIKTRLGEAIADRYRRDMTAEGATETDIQGRVDRTIRRTNEPPLIIVLCRDATVVTKQPDEFRQHAHELMSVQSVAMAGLELLLAVHAEGLGGTWICWPLFTPGETKTALELPKTWEPQGMVFIGQPDETPNPKELKPLKDLTITIGC
jgi:coenzyme F420-0:L-glutamate ligase / coenzyme F420-1:gamma-L-glutamate ligase